MTDSPASEDAAPPVLRMGADLTMVVLGVMVALLGGVIMLLRSGSDPRDLVVGAVTVVAGVIASLVGWSWRRRLTADASGLTLRGLISQRHVPWSDIAKIATMPPRASVGKPLLMIELRDESLIVLSPTEVGRPGDVAADQLREFRHELG